MVAQIFSWRASGVGSWEIASRLNEAGVKTRNGNDWDDQKLWWIIVELTYTGRGRYGRRQYYRKDNGDREIQVTKWMPEDTLVEVEYPRIVDDRTWDLAQLHRKNSTRQPIGNKPRQLFPLHGLLWCDHCGSKYTIATQHTYRRRKGDDGAIVLERTDKLTRRYVCNKGKQMRHGCPKRTISSSMIENIVWGEVTRFLTNPSQLWELIDERRRNIVDGGPHDELEAARAKVADVELEKGRTINLYTKGIIAEAELDIRLKGVNERLEYFGEQVSRLEAEVANVAQILDALDDYVATAGGLQKRLDTMDDTEKAETVRLLVDRVIAEDRGYKIIMALDSRGFNTEPPRRRKNPCQGRCPT